MFKIKLSEARQRLHERGLRITYVQHQTRDEIIDIAPDGTVQLLSFGQTRGHHQTHLDDADLVDAEYLPLALDKGCYWLFIVPVPEDDVGWKWAASVWRKGDDRNFTEFFKRTIEDIETEASRWMKCDEPRPRRPAQEDLDWAAEHLGKAMVRVATGRCPDCGRELGESEVCMCVWTQGKTK